MKTHERLKLDNDDLAQAIKTMKCKECEKHARKIADKLGVDYYKALHSAVHGIILSNEDAHVAQRVHSCVWEFVQKESNCIESKAEILSALLLMQIYKRTNNFKTISEIEKELGVIH